MESMISYILFNPETRELLGGYLQYPPPEHEHRILVDDNTRLNWPLYLLNDDATAVVLNPIYQPGYEPPAEPDPEEPPVDPDPEPPVQSVN